MPTTRRKLPATRAKQPKKDEPAAVHAILDSASRDDIPVLVQHRRLMFEEMDSIHGLLLEGDQIAAMERAYSEFLRVKLEEGTTAAWVVREAGRVVSSGAVTFLQWPPSPRDAVTHAALVHSVYTLHERRRRGYAKQILQAAVDYCRKYGIHRVKLGASDAGRALYESLGFRPATSEMQLLLD